MSKILRLLMQIKPLLAIIFRLGHSLMKIHKNMPHIHSNDIRVLFPLKTSIGFVFGFLEIIK